MTRVTLDPRLRPAEGCSKDGRPSYYQSSVVIIKERPQTGGKVVGFLCPGLKYRHGNCFEPKAAPVVRESRKAVLKEYQNRYSLLCGY